MIDVPTELTLEMAMRRGSGVPQCNILSRMPLTTIALLCLSHITARDAVAMQKCQTPSHIARHRANDRQCSPMIGCIFFASPPIMGA